MDDFKWYFIELPKFRKQNPDMSEKLNQWIALIDGTDGGLLKMAEKSNDVIKKVRTEIEYLSGDEEMKRLQWLREKWEMDRASAESYAREEGRAEGKAEAKAENEKVLKQEKIDIAKRLLENGIDILVIMKTTGLSKEEIDNLKSN